MAKTRLRGRTVMVFLVSVVILSFANLCHRTQVLLTRLEQLEKQSDCREQVSFPSNRARGKSPISSFRGGQPVTPWGEEGGPVRTRMTEGVVHQNAAKTYSAKKEYTQAQTMNRTVHFIHTRDLEIPHDAFSATFWQSKERFLRIALSPIRSVEGAVFEQLRERTRSGKLQKRLVHQIRMTVDWMDFSVEHLSKWWRTLDYDRGPSPIAYHSLVHKLLSYIEKMPPQVPILSDAMSRTVAVIAYAPYYSDLKPAWGQVITVVNVAATVASLTRHGIGRVVVVGEDTTAKHNSQALVQAAFRLVQSRSSPSNPRTEWEDTIAQLIEEEERRLATMAAGRAEMQIDHTSVTFANVSTSFSWVIKGTNKTNSMTLVPKAALVYLQDALRGRSKDPDLWLGPGKSPDDYRYVYLTEPDTVLQMRPSAIESIRHQMDQGNFLAPHRIQPAPHETDVPGYKDNRQWIPNFGIMSNITVLHSDTDACCDNGIKRPKDAFPKCNSNWWACGYTRDILTAEERVAKHSRVHPYALIRLGDTSSNLVLHAATNHGRRCSPQRHAVCPPLV